MVGIVEAPGLQQEEAPLVGAGTRSVGRNGRRETLG